MRAARTAVRLLRLVAPFGWWMALAVALGAATVASGVGLLATSAYVISAAALHPSIADLSVAITGVRFFGLARGVFRYLERYVSHAVNFRLLARLRVWFYTAIEPLAPAQLMHYKSGDLLARAVADIETLQDFYVRVIAPPAVAAVIGLAMAASLWPVHPGLAGVVVVFAGLAGLGLPLVVGLAARGSGQGLVAGRAALNAGLVDDIQGLADLAANGQEERALAVLDAQAKELGRRQRQMAWIGGLQSGLSSVLAYGGVWAALAAGIALVEAGRLSGVYLAVVVLAVSASFEAVQPLPAAAQALEAALTAARRLFAVADTAPLVAEPVRPAPAPATSGLAARGLSFSYGAGERPALLDVSFELPPGKRLAVVGPSGAGKSTLVNVLLRLAECGAGQIWLDGRDLREYAQADVRQLVGVVPQRTHLFNATLGENIRLARPAASPDDIRRAAQAAELHDFIAGLPEGYDTWIGERGVRLSGGQRQRLAIARALLRDAPLLVLDEPTANVDPATERALLRTLLANAGGRSLLLITHRLVGLDALDEILVLDQGRGVQRGTHAELVATDGLYRRLWALQNRAATAQPTP